MDKFKANPDRKPCGCGQGGQWSCEICQPGVGDIPRFDEELPDSMFPEHGDTEEKEKEKKWKK